MFFGHFCTLNSFTDPSKTPIQIKNNTVHQIVLCFSPSDGDSCEQNEKQDREV